VRLTWIDGRLARAYERLMWVYWQRLAWVYYRRLTQGWHRRLWKWFRILFSWSSLGYVVRGVRLWEWRQDTSLLWNLIHRNIRSNHCSDRC
jgi:hypothetical protein